MPSVVSKGVSEITTSAEGRTQSETRKEAVPPHSLVISPPAGELMLTTKRLSSPSRIASTMLELSEVSSTTEPPTASWDRSDW